MQQRSVNLFRDSLLWVLGVIVLACLVVSAPATRSIVGIFHDDGTLYGVAASWALLIILEAGTVAAKLATLQPGAPLAWLHRVFVIGLAINGVSNLIAGLRVGASWQLGGWLLWGGALLYAASVPALTALMLHLFCERVRWLGARPPASVEAQVTQSLAPVVYVAAAYRALMHEVARLDAPALPSAPQVYARPAGYPAPQSVHECPRCGAEMTPAEWGAYKRHGARWRGCKACRQPPD